MSTPRPHLRLVKDERRDERVPLVLRIDAPDTPGFLGATENLSAGGLFIRTERALAPGTRVPLLVSFPGLLDAVELEIEVVWVRPATAEVPAGVAVVVPVDHAGDRATLARLAELATADRAPLRGYRILLVEDNVQVEAMYTEVLRRFAGNDGASVVVEHARDGLEAFTRLAREPAVDLVVTDLYMPGMDGFSLIERVRADAALAHTPIVAISAGGPEACERAIELGVDVYLQKPVKISAIIETVRALLE